MKPGKISAKAAAYAAQLESPWTELGGVASIDNAGNILISWFRAKPGTVQMPCERFPVQAGRDPVLELQELIRERPDFGGGPARSAELYAQGCRIAFNREPPEPKRKT